MCWGTKTLLETLRDFLPGESVTLWGREELREVTKQRLAIGYNLRPETEVLLVNARARPSRQLRTVLAREGEFVAVAEGGVVAARTRASSLVPGPLTTRALMAAAKPLERLEAGPDLLFQGGWDLVESNGMAIVDFGSRSPEPTPIPDGVTVKGAPSNIRIDGTAEVDSFVSVDARLGPVIVGERATIESFSVLSGPCFVGEKSRIRSALIRGGTSIFENCRVGGEVENSIVMSYSNKAHQGYLGDSIVGEWVNIGAGGTVSNLKNTYGTIRSTVGGKRVDTGMIKFGVLIGDMAKVSIGAMISSGKNVGAGSHVAGPVELDVPAFTYYDGTSGRMVELSLGSAMETQRRMMERRGRTPSKWDEALLQLAFRGTAMERRLAKVRKGPLRPP